MWQIIDWGLPRTSPMAKIVANCVPQTTAPDSKLHSQWGQWHDRSWQVQPKVRPTAGCSWHKANDFFWLWCLLHIKVSLGQIWWWGLWPIMCRELQLQIVNWNWGQRWIKADGGLRLGAADCADSRSQSILDKGQQQIKTDNGPRKERPTEDYGHWWNNADIKLKPSEDSDQCRIESKVPINCDANANVYYTIFL